MAPARVLIVASLTLLLLGGWVAPIATANPTVPYCGGSVAPVPRTAPPVIMPEVCEQLTGRVFPEAIADEEYASRSPDPATGYASDFVAYPEFQAGIEYLNEQYPSRMEIHEVAQSYGLATTPGGPRDRFPIYIIEVTNEESLLPKEQKLEILFMVSIHGNEKGGREGGMRAMEDMIAGRGIFNEKVQNGAGMPQPLSGPNGEPVEIYGDYLDFMRIFFLYPNVDGWMHDELPYVFSEAALCGTLYCRGNGNGTDLNRQMPTIGWQLQNAGSGRIAVNEPEARGYLSWLVDGHKWAYAIDIHGQLNHENFVPVMMPAGSFSPQEMLRSTRLAETLKERLNNDPHFSQWTTICGTGDQQAGQTRSPSSMACSGEFADWSTVWDAIGYTDSGFSGDFFAQSTGLNAPGYDIEMSYNHITVDSQYEAGALFNDYHVHVVRSVVKSFMDAAALDVQVSYDTGGQKTLYIESAYVATNLDDLSPTPGGWADNNTADDHWQYSAENPIRARPSKYFSDMVPFLKDGDKPGVLTPTTAGGLTKELLDQHEVLIIPGSAINQFAQGTPKSNEVADGTVNEAKVKLVMDWVNAGGNLILTDGGLEFLDYAKITDNAVGSFLGYAGAINLDRAHELSKDVRGEARQMYEPVPLGFAVGINSPIWAVNASAFQGIGGDVAGTGYIGNDVSLGRLTVGSGKIQFIGALLPDPTEEFYHPYGLDDYATTYSGNQILRNMLGWTQEFAAPPVVISGDGIVQSDSEPLVSSNPGGQGGSGDGDEDGEGTPGLGFDFVLLAVAAVALGIAMRRRN